jgi:hypothetical protein
MRILIIVAPFVAMISGCANSLPVCWSLGCGIEGERINFQPKLKAVEIPCSDGKVGCFELVEDRTTR